MCTVSSHFISSFKESQRKQHDDQTQKESNRKVHNKVQVLLRLIWKFKQVENLAVDAKHQKVISWTRESLGVINIMFAEIGIHGVLDEIMLRMFFSVLIN